MSIGLNGVGLGSAGGVGGGLRLRNPPDEFAGATLAAARTARTNYFNQAANAAALRQFQRDPGLAIVLRPQGADAVWETYAPGHDGEAYNAAHWLQRTAAVQGPRGPAGPAPAAAQLLTEANLKALLDRIGVVYEG